MSSFALVVYYMVKEVVNPRLHHANFQEFIDDVERDVAKHTKNSKYMKYIKFLNSLSNEY